MAYRRIPRSVQLSRLEHKGSLVPPDIVFHLSLLAMPSPTHARKPLGRALVTASQARTESPTLTILNSSNRSVNLALRRDNHVFAAQNDVQPGQSWTCTSSSLSISAFTIDVREARGPHSSFVVGQWGDWSPRASDALMGVIGHGVGALALGALSLFGGRLSTAVRVGALAQAGNQAIEAFEGELRYANDKMCQFTPHVAGGTAFE
jgi:hypothetical protein